MPTIKHMQRKRVKEGGRLGGKNNKNCQLQEAWVWPAKVTELLRPMIRGRSINVCCGLSKLGDVRVDLYPKQSTAQKADMNELPFEDDSFDTVISDPPWKIEFFKRMEPFRECIRICKLDGRIIYNCTWKPVSRYVQLEKAIIRTDNNFANVSVIWIFKKIADVPKK